MGQEIPMRATATLLALGLMVMPYGILGQGMAQPAAAQERKYLEPAPQQRPPGMISVEEQIRLTRLLHGGKISEEQYKEAAGMNRPPLPDIPPINGSGR
jgi:hypothetical protein